MLSKIKQLNSNFFSKIIEVRHHLHQNPELSWEEINTSKYIHGALTAMGIEAEVISNTGVVGLIKGNDPNQNCVALRADMDALPIQEKSDKKYCSKVENVMHACGHDVHTASLLGTAMILNELKAEWSGTIKLIFQPSEEKQPSGAKAMIQAGVLNNPKVACIIGQHVTPELEVGKIGYRAGKFMASADELYIKIIGKGGHAATPHKCIDPIIVGAHMVIELQEMVRLNANISTPTILSIGDFRGLGATNIIPEFVELKGTLRTFDETWRATMHEKIKSLCMGIAESFGAKCEVNIPEGLPYVANDFQITEIVKNAASEYLHPNAIEEMEIRMGAEDFAYYTHHVPACFYRLGTGNIKKGISSNIHTPTFDVDEEVFKHSSGTMAWMALELLKMN